MRVGAVAGPPQFARPQRPEPVASQEPAAVDGADTTPDDAPEAARKGSDTPFTHALHQGNGRKLGIHKRFAAEIAAQQAAAGLGQQTPDATDPVASDVVTDGNPDADVVTDPPPDADVVADASDGTTGPATDEVAGERIDAQLV